MAAVFSMAMIFLLSNNVYALDGLGPDDLYGGPSVNANYCTPYNILPAGTPDEERYHYPDPNYIETDPDHYAYWTQGNNISRMITNDGVHNAIAAWQQNGLACIYPKGSAYKMIRSFGPDFFFTGEVNGREPKDTCNARFIAGTQHAGRIPTDLGYINENWDAIWGDKYVGTSNMLLVSTRPDDIPYWHPEFSDENGEPIVISDEDVVVIYTPLGYGAAYNWGAQRTLLDYGGYTWLEYQERILSFSAAVARDIQFNDITMINKSQYHTFPQIGAYDMEDIVAGPGGIFEMGDELGGQKIAWIEGLRFGFCYEEDFSDPAVDGLTPMGGVVTLEAFPVLNRETGEVEEAELASFSGTAESAWAYYPPNPVSNGLEYRMIKGESQFQFLQDPGLNWDNPGGMNLLISRGNQDRLYQYYHQKNTLCPGDTTRLAYALVCGFPSVGDPASMATSPEGLAQVAAELIQNAAMAKSLYETDYSMPRPPQSPNVRIIPGDHQVTVTWDNISEYSRDGFYDQYAGQGTDYREFDFEGYRVYRSTTGEADDAQLLAQFDMKNGVVLETGIMNETVDLVDADGNELGTGQINTYTDTLGISEHDPSTGARYGLGTDNGLRYSYIDKYEERVAYGAQATNQHRLTNGFRYFYAVTAYDWNGIDQSNLSTMNSLESSLSFNVSNMVIPGSNPSSYRTALIDDELTKIQMLSSSGNELDTEFRDIWVQPKGDGSGAMVITDGAVPSNALSDPFIYIVNPELITEDAEYFIQIDSIIGAPSNLDNPDVNPDYDSKLMSNIFVSLKDAAG